MFYQYQKNNKISESEKIFSKFLLPVHQKFSNHITLFKQFPCLTLEAKIKIYTLKVLRNLENAKCLCKYECTNDREGDKFLDEIGLQDIDLDYDTIHSEILDNIIFDENDSGLSDFDDEDEIQERKIFEINKIKTIIHKSVKNLFAESQENDMYKPLIQQEKDFFHYNNEKNENIEKEKVIENNMCSITNNNEIKTQENTDDLTEVIKEKEINNIENNSNSNDVNFEKEKEIVNYKKYNFFTDPYSNYNNFTKKFKVKINSKKRYRDIHPFLKTFNPKFLKKENIDKKIFRRFRKFVKTFYKENKDSPIFSKNPFFWKKFYLKNLLPPVKIMLNDSELIEHKSFNTQYLVWLFNQEGTTELFKLFIEKESENVINNFINEYNLYQSNENNIIKKLKEYIKYIPEIYESYNNKKVILEENKEINDTYIILNGKKEEDVTNLESFDSEYQYSNPFDLNFNLVGNKKNFKEYPYDNNDNNGFYYEGGNNYNNFLKKNHDINFKNEKFEIDDSCDEGLSKTYYK